MGTRPVFVIFYRYSKPRVSLMDEVQNPSARSLPSRVSAPRMVIMSPTSFPYLLIQPGADSMLIAEEVGRGKQKSGIKAFLRMLTLAEWTMGLLCLVIAATGAAGVFIAIQGPTGPQDLVEAAERQCAKFAHGSGGAHPDLDRANLRVGKPAQKAKNLFKPDERAWVEIGSIDKQH